MKVSRTWLQNYFIDELPSADELADKLTFHAFEIEEHDDDLIDVNVLPDRAAYGLCHRGIAKELSAILNMPLKEDPLRSALPDWQHTDKLVIETDKQYVVRHMGALIKNLKVGPSPNWLQNALESVGQRSINNVVDILNYVLLNIGQPAGAFDLSKIQKDDDVYRIAVRRAKPGESITILTGESYELTEDMFVFTDATGGMLLDVAGIKGGLSSGVTESTTDIFLSVGNYDGTLIRRASQKLKLFTDASQRYQNRPSPELTAYGMRDLLEFLTEIAGGEVVGVVDDYPVPQTKKEVSVTAEHIASLIGISYSKEEIASVFSRLDMPFSQNGSTFTVTSPFERNDITVAEDLIDEVGRIYGYARVEPQFLFADGEVDQAHFRGIEKVKDELVEQGYIEVSTQSFSEKGDIKLANPLDKEKPYLRTNLKDNLANAVKRGKEVAPLLGLTKPKLFEVGSVFTKGGECMDTATSDDAYTFSIKDDALYEPKRYMLGMYQPFSVYPFLLRDIAVWVPEGTSMETVGTLIREHAGEHLVRLDLFDEFKKDGRISYAFHLVFQSYERTLTDAEIGPVMDKITKVLNGESGFEVR